MVDPDTNEITVVAFDKDGFAAILSTADVTVVDLPKATDETIADGAFMR